MRTIDANYRGLTVLGKFDEFNTTVVRFDIADLCEEYAGCEVSLVHKRHGDKIAMPIANFEVVDGIGLWTVSEADTAYVGHGQAEIIFHSDTKRRKSVTYNTMVDESPSGDETEPPHPLKSWVDKVLEAAGHITGFLEWDNIQHKPNKFPPEDHTHDADELTYTEKVVHTVGSIGEAIANLKIPIVNELPVPEEKYYGRLMILHLTGSSSVYGSAIFGTNMFAEEGGNDFLYICMMKNGELIWVKLKDIFDTYALYA